MKTREPERASAAASDARTVEKLTRRTALLESQNDGSVEGVLLVDAEGCVVSVNRRFRELWGVSAAESCVGAHVDVLITRALERVEDPDAVHASLRWARENPLASARREVRLKDGRVLERWTTAVTAEDGTLHGRAWYFRDVTERERAEVTLGRERDRLQDALRRLGDAHAELEAFSYRVSHDIRAPLRGLSFLTRVLEEDHAETFEPDARKVVDRMRVEIDRLTRLVNDLFQFSQAAQHDLDVAAVDVTGMVNGIIDALRERHPDRVVDAHVDAGVTARADTGLLHVVLENLLENAWKYTGQRDRAVIRVTGSTDASGVVTITVHDNGIGFSAAEAGRLFQAFERLTGARAFEGSGIGLATVKRIVERHGGTVTAEGEPGAGARFSVTLP